MFRDPRLDMRRPRALYEVFPGNSITTAHVVTGLGQLIAEHFGKETAAAIIARQDERFAWKLRDAPVQFRRRHAAQAQIDGAVDMLRGKVGGRTDVEEDRLFLTQQAARLIGADQSVFVFVRRDGAQFLNAAGGKPLHRTVFNKPFLQPADDKLTINPLLGQGFADFRTPLAVVTEHNGLLAGEIDVLRRQVGEAHRHGAGKRSMACSAASRTSRKTMSLRLAEFISLSSFSALAVLTRSGCLSCSPKVSSFASASSSKPAGAREGRSSVSSRRDRCSL